MKKFFKRLLKHRSAQIGGIVVILVILMAIFAPVLAPEGYDRQNLFRRFEPPSSETWFGTDQMGREITTRIIWGARISLMVGTLSVIIGVVGGGFLGLVSGYYGGNLDRFIMGLMEVLLAFPGILLALTVVAILGPGLTQVMVAVGIARIPQFARLIRGSTLSVREKDYIEAQRALGSRDSRILFRHILPNVLAPVLVMGTLSIGTSILAAAGLSFLGLGAQPPIPDWGGMLSEGRAYLRTAWWVGVFPGIFIMFTVLGFNLLGDGLRDILDPRLQRR